MPDSKDKGGKKDPPAPDSPADWALWQDVARTVRPYAPQKPRSAPSAGRVRAKAPRAAVAETPVLPATAGAGGIDGAMARKMRRGQLEIEAKLDLHGLSRAAALTALRQFVFAAVRAGRRNVLVVTGKGPVGGGVLRQSLPQWLAEEPDLRAHVLAFRPAQPKDGGAGAWYLRLRRGKTG